MRVDEMKLRLKVVVRLTGRPGRVTQLWADGAVSVRTPGMTVNCRPEDLDPAPAKEATP